MTGSSRTGHRHPRALIVGLIVALLLDALVHRALALQAWATPVRAPHQLRAGQAHAGRPIEVFERPVGQRRSVSPPSIRCANLRRPGRAERGRPAVHAAVPRPDRLIGGHLILCRSVATLCALALPSSAGG
ncbi:MAG: hypothetical protein R3F55_21765 [Alphaproteobacteria bacterium]